MAFVFFNPNPEKNLVGDCVIRAISKLTNRPWEDVYMDIALQGFMMHDMPSSNEVWSTYLKEHGFKATMIPDTCPACYTVRQFADDHQNGTYLLAIGSHVVAVQDGNYYDTWDSGNEIPIYYWERR